MVELIVLFSFVAMLLVGGGVYLSDRKGWNRTLGRVSRTARASIESRKGLALESRVGSQKALKAEWESEFTGKPMAAVSDKKHLIVRHDYYPAFNGAWPRWTCKCGATGRTSTGIWSEQETIRKTVQEGKDHVRIFNDVEEKKASKEQFMF